MTRSSAFICVHLWLFSGLVAPSVAQTTRPASPEVVPWVECFPTASKWTNPVVQGNALWARDAAIRRCMVTVDVLHPEHLQPFVAAAPRGLSIIPSLKLTNLWADWEKGGTSYRHNDPEAWQQIADGVRAAQRICGGYTVGIECEKQMEPVFKGLCQVNYAQLRESLKPMPRDLEYWWWPGIFWPPDQATRCERWMLGIESSLGGHVRWIDWLKSGWRLHPDLPQNEIDARYRLLLGASQLAPIPIYYGDPSLGVRPQMTVAGWSADQFRAAIKSSTADIVLIYPGHAGYVPFSRIWSGESYESVTATRPVDDRALTEREK